jgi:hypothetical protein
MLNICATNSIFSNIPVTKSNKKSLFDNKNVFTRCNHKDKICAFYIGGENNCICHKCIYKYDINQNDYIPLEHDLYHYVSVYNEYLKKMESKIVNDVEELLKEIIKLNLYDFDSMSEKIDLKFKLPIEVPFEQRIKIGINRQLSKILNNFMNSQLLDNCLSLYNSEIENIKTKIQNSYEKEVIKLNSEIPFTLKGLIIPKQDCQNYMNFSFKKKLINIVNGVKPLLSVQSNNLFNLKDEEEKKNDLEDVKINVNFEKSEDNDFTLVRFGKSIFVNNNEEYEITISDIKGCALIDSSEEYNYHNKICIQTSNNDSILAGIVIE